MTATRWMPRRVAYEHLQAVRHGEGTAQHLREVHRLPEELVDSKDQRGMIADHAWLHGWRSRPDGSGFVPREETL